MATTRILTIHVNKGKSIAKTLSERIDYAQNPDKTVDKIIGVGEDSPIEKIIAHNTNYVRNSKKTSGGKLVKTYACSPYTVDADFFISKKDYDYTTGRGKCKRDVLAYHIRQAFKPGEIEPQKALEIGYELAMRFTKGKHAFVVATHTDKAHIHNHIIFNSTALSHDRKFREPKRSGEIIQRISDLLCLENGLSVIENHEQSKSVDYAKWLENAKTAQGTNFVNPLAVQPTWRELLRQKIDDILPNCTSFDEFISAMKSAGYKVNTDRKYITFLADGQKKPIRLNSLKGAYTEDAIRKRISEISSRPKPLSEDNSASGLFSEVQTNSRTIRVSLLIDIQAKIQEGKGAGYEHFSHLFNIKEMSKTLLYLKDKGIDNYDELVEKSSKASKGFSAVTSEIKSIESRLKAISELQRQIGTYGKTREVYKAYKHSKFSPDFYESHRSDIALHEAARKHFDGLGIAKLPKISELKQEYAELSARKKKLYAEYHVRKKESHELGIAKYNAERILGIEKGHQKSGDVYSKSNAEVHEI